MESIVAWNGDRLVLIHHDRWRRFGAEWVIATCEMKDIELVVNPGKEPSFEEKVAQDVRSMITIFSARVYSNQSHKRKKLFETLKARWKRDANHPAASKVLNRGK